MANWRSFCYPLLHCRRSMLKTWWNCSNQAAGFHHSTCDACGGGLVSPVRSPSVFPSSGEEATVVADVVVVDAEEARGSLPLRWAPCLMLPARSCLVAQSSAADDGGDRLKLVTMEEDERERDYYRFFSIREKKVTKMKTKTNLVLLPWQRELLPPHDAVCFGSSRGWLAFLHPLNSSLYLFNPFIHSYLPFLPLPPIQTLPCFISSSRHNSMRHNNNNNIFTEFTMWTQFSPISSQDLNKNPFFKKIALSSSPTPFPSNHHLHLDRQEEINNNNSSSECTVMAIQGYNKHELSFCRIGDTAWTALDGVGMSYKDVTYFSKDRNFYALSTVPRLVEAWDLRHPASPNNTTIISDWPPRVHPTMDEQQGRLRRNGLPDRYLVESSGELLMVVRFYADYKYETIAFDVYKLDFVSKEWLLLPSLGDRALFIGINDSVSVSASDFPGLAENSIYFTSPGDHFSRGSHDLGVFNLEDNSITPIYDYDSNIELPSPWIVPDQDQQ